MERSLKLCEIGDLKPLASLARETFIAAFGQQNDPVDFESYMKSAFSDDALREELANPDSVFYLVREQDVNVGYFKLNFNNAQTDIREATSCELERIYVAPLWQGLGIGKWMLDRAIGIALQHEKNYMWLGVWEKNISAIRFYEKLGFVKFGTHPYYIGSDKQTDWLMRIDLVPS